MSWIQARDLLQKIFEQVNTQNNIAAPQQIWDQFEEQIIQLLASSNTNPTRYFTQLNDIISLPQSVEFARILKSLRQRRQVEDVGRDLVGQIRIQTKLRERPNRKITISDLKGHRQQIAKIGKREYYSRFQVDGWQRVLDTIRKKSGLVIVAPTGAGKTEVFLLPILYGIAQALHKKGEMRHFIFLYPRTTLLKDQLARIFKYVDSVEQEVFDGTDDMFTNRKQVSHKIVVGFQFSGIASEAKATWRNPDIFENERYFRIVEQCPVCEKGRLEKQKRKNRITPLKCNNQDCGAKFDVSLSKNDHIQTKPHILVTTVESLDGLYFTPRPEYEAYLRDLTGIIFDEVHLYDSLYGVHVFKLVQAIENLKENQPLAKISSSATVSSPNRFAAKLFYGDENRPVTVHQPNNSEMIPDGMEVIYFLQSPTTENAPSTSSTLIQTVEAVGHGFLTNDKRGLVFTESVDMAHRLQAQIQDAEDAENNQGGLWRFRTILDEIIFEENRCPKTTPIQCNALYQNGECWRGVIGGLNCTSNINIRDTPLNITCVSSRSKGDFWDPSVQIVTATSALEVGVDDDRIQATFHYRPPRTVFNFIQRRGRAGRQIGDIAYTFMILGTESSDHFYFFRRNRLLNSTYELPLNPNNAVIQSMHASLHSARQRMKEHIERQRPQKGILAWILETLQKCSVIRQYYDSQIREIKSQHSYKNRKERFLAWIRDEVNRFDAYLNLRQTLNQIEDSSPDHLREDIRQVFVLIDQYLKEGQIDQKNIQAALIDIDRELRTLAFQEQNEEELENLRDLGNRLLDVWQIFVGQSRFEVDTDLAESFHDFFRTLNKFNDPDRRDQILNYAPDVLKTVLQAFFYLNVATQKIPSHQNCISCTAYFIPNAYFQQVKPLIIEVRTNRTVESPRLEQENITYLSSLFLPYRISYRYRDHPYLSTIETAHDPSLVHQQNGRTIVELDLRGEGIRRGNTFLPRKIYVRSIRGDKAGDGIFKLCPQCYMLYSENRYRKCHGQNLIPVKVYATPVIERSGEVNQSQRITQTFDFIEEMNGGTTVLGSDVEAHQQIWENQRYVRKQSQPIIEFQARYRQKVAYTLPTKGIRWNLKEIIDCVLQNNSLQQQIKALPIPKTLDQNLVLHTAAHMLYKAIAAISGVNEEVLEYAIDQKDTSISVWERYEGGAGISEIVRETLRSNPKEFYRELLASAICPVNLAEQIRWNTSQELQTYLTQNWHLAADDELLASIIQEVHSERQDNEQRRQEKMEKTCLRNDGCPICLHLTYCVAERENRDHVVSRLVAEELMHCLVQTISRNELERLMNENFSNNLPAPVMLTANPATGDMNVLLFIEPYQVLSLNYY